jgi:hypothetical protein
VKKKLMLKANCRNHWEMEGYAEDIKHKLDNKGRPELVFKLTSLNTKRGDDITHITPVKIVLKNKQIEYVLEFLKPMMLVLCEGNYQLGGNGKSVMACQRVTPCEPYITEIEYELAETEKREEAEPCRT